MHLADFIILIIYGGGILFVGSILARRNRNSDDMFAARKQSPWWLSGLSSFMSAFSAGTFVVWGGIAYKSGMVAVSILICSGIGSFMVGRFFAYKWASLGITSVGQYIQMRFGKQAVQFYTWVGMIFKIAALAVALYSFAILVCPLITLSPANLLADPRTGNLSVNAAILISGGLMLVYAVSGGLWAVLIVDSIQFVVLMTTVLFVVPLCFAHIGGVERFISGAPSGFLSPASGQFTYLFLIGWIIVHTFKLGGEWVFIQRFLAVRSPKDARKSSYLIGSLYVISPIIWMLPPMIYKVIDPAAPPEQAYILACALVLPPGMVGLLLAAMFSSAASYIDGEVNVYAGAVTKDIYKAFIAPGASERHLLLVGRINSFLIGGAIIGIALLVPYLGGAEGIVLTITGLLVVAMVLPLLWGLYFGKIRQSSIWWCTGVTVAAALFVKQMIPAETANPVFAYYNAHAQTLDVAIGLLVPIICLAVSELFEIGVSEGFIKVQAAAKRRELSSGSVQFISFPAKLIAISICGLAVLMLSLLLVPGESSKEMIALFSVVLLGISGTIFWMIRKSERNSRQKNYKNQVDKAYANS